MVRFVRDRLPLGMVVGGLNRPICPPVTISVTLSCSAGEGMCRVLLLLLLLLDASGV